MKILVATRSGHKLREIRAILRDVPGIRLVAPGQVGLAPEPEEAGIEAFDTFEANARAKAEWFRERSGLPALADDSGLVVDALGGEPGVRSKRFAPVREDVDPDERDRANNEYLVRRLGDRPLPERTARYVCVAVLDFGEGDAVVCRGEAEGLILGLGRGRGGFGYDPLFFDPELGRTFAEIEPAEKDARSHRGKAFRALAREIARIAQATGS